MRPAIGGAEEGASTASRRDELLQLRRFAESTHPRGCAAAADAGWRSVWDVLEDKGPRYVDGRYLIDVRRALTWFEDGHTNVLPFEYTGGVPEPLAKGPFANELPFRVKIFSDGVWCTDVREEARPLLGCRLTHVGDVTVGQLLREHAKAWPGNEAWAQNWASPLFSSPALLQGFDAWRDPDRAVSVRVVDGRGEARAAELRARRAVPSAPDISMIRRATRVEGWRKAARSGNFVHVLPSDRVAYVSIDDMSDSEQLTFAAFAQAVQAALADRRFTRLVIDLRRNGGGDNTLCEPLRKYLERSRFNAPGALRVLIGPATFSAAQNFATRLERETAAYFVGLPTGGKPNQYGDPKVWVGSATGITAIVSTVPWFDSAPQDQRPWIMPDKLVLATFADWMQGRDPALDFALTSAMPMNAHEARDDTQPPWERRSQRESWQPFWRMDK